MKKVFIITWGSKSPLGFDFNEDMVFSTRKKAEKAEKALKEDDWDGVKYSIKEVSEVFIYLYMYLGNTNDLISFTDNENDLKMVYDFLENVRDEKLVEQYLGQALTNSFFTFDRRKWLDRKISEKVFANRTHGLEFLTKEWQRGEYERANNRYFR